MRNRYSLNIPAWTIKPGTRVEAEEFATSVVSGVFELLEEQDLCGEDNIFVDVTSNGTQFTVELTPRQGRAHQFWVRPKGGRRTPFVGGFVEINDGELWFQPEYYTRDALRGRCR